MGALSNTYDPLTCPLLDPPNGVCGADLHVKWTGSMSLHHGDITDPEALFPNDAHTGTWSVICEEGHTILIPTKTFVDDPDGTVDQDYSEELRTFHASDGARLAYLLNGGGRL
jgi:hypothetical protein